MDSVYKLNFNSSLAHIIGNISMIVMEHYKNQYPRKLFNSFYMNTSLSSRKFMEKRQTGFDLKMQKPILAVNPTVIADRPEFATTSYYNDTFGKDIYDVTGNTPVTSTLFFNKERPSKIVEISVNRIKMTFEINQTYETAMQQLNAFGILRSSFRLDHPYYIKNLVEVLIPDVIINELRDAADMTDSSDDDFLKYLNQYSQYPIQYKLKTSTGNKCYFFIIPTNIWITAETPSLSDGERKEMNMHNFEITHNLNVEFNYIDCFYMLTNKPMSTSKLDIYNDNLMSEQVVVPVLTSQIGLHIPQVNDNGNTFYTASEILLDTIFDREVDFTNVTGLFTVFDLDMIKTIAEHEGLKTSETFKRYYEVEVYDEANKLEEGKGYTFDYDKLELGILNPNPFTHYVIVIYRNNIDLNIKIAELNEYDNK